jgi:hypothetical protein
MVEVRYRGDKGSPAQRVADRLKPSNPGVAVANVRTQFGHGPRRVISTHHHSGGQGRHEAHGSQSLSDLPIVQTGGRILGQRGTDND